MSDIEHARQGGERVDGHAARVAGVSAGRANDQGKVARAAATERGREGVSIMKKARRGFVRGRSSWFRQMVEHQ